MSAYYRVGRSYVITHKEGTCVSMLLGQSLNTDWKKILLGSSATEESSVTKIDQIKREAKLDCLKVNVLALIFFFRPGPCYAEKR